MTDGLVLRTARPDDLDAISALLTDRGAAADAVDHRLVVEDPEVGWDACAVVVDGDRVVSTATLFDETLVLDGVPIPAGQVELVATDRAYEGRGLVRRLMDWAHDRSARRGHLAQLMLGIPYFYRQFGYTYALPIAAVRPVRDKPDANGHTIRVATPADIPAAARLQDAAQAGADLSMPHSPALRRWLLDRDGSTVWVVERAGAVVATGRTTPPEEGNRLAEVAADDEAAAHALLALTGATEVSERPGTVAGDALEPLLHPGPEEIRGYYVRVPDTFALFAHLKPVFDRRLAGLGRADGEALISFFREHLRLPFREGALGTPLKGGRMQGPYDLGGAGVAPDQVASLLFGPHGIRGLARIFPDVYPGPDRELMYALFPPVRADILTFYLP
ncbi:GNAT family N-acetyltransferase [Saccharothrix violaceirubra]|uniref:Putative N-acetyltransferase YhbS n=1 Tax=Saccharothrix violaceirubra TaxID=413306 RepID=A0A7W7T2C7_9PSEU|nr:GNAT family N-acetyltransferase [Saccharothrix violaceirubra]MBB4964961.1 putative N-acetyltransferase YhbS [Saccharothrix violaceirubra]